MVRRDIILFLLLWAIHRWWDRTVLLRLLSFVAIDSVATGERQGNLASKNGRADQGTSEYMMAVRNKPWRKS